MSASHKITLLLMLSVALSSLQAQDTAQLLTTGPEHGTLIVAGGGKLGDDIIEKFIELAGGPNAEIVFVPTAGGSDTYKQDYRGANLFRQAGAKNVTILHTRDRQEANTKTFVKPLETATGVWFSGGRQWRLVDSFKNTLTEKMFWEVLHRGGVIGGSSAGATI